MLFFMFKEVCLLLRSRNYDDKERSASQLPYKFGVFSCPYFPVFKLKRVIYRVNFCILSEHRKMQTRKKSGLAQFLRGVCEITYLWRLFLFERKFRFNCTENFNCYCIDSRSRLIISTFMYLWLQRILGEILKTLPVLPHQKNYL